MKVSLKKKSLIVARMARMVTLAFTYSANTAQYTITSSGDMINLGLVRSRKQKSKHTYLDIRTETGSKTLLKKPQMVGYVINKIMLTSLFKIFRFHKRWDILFCLRSNDPF